jgi:hypothetical protein
VTTAIVALTRTRITAAAVVIDRPAERELVEHYLARSVARSLAAPIASTI